MATKVKSPWILKSMSVLIFCSRENKKFHLPVKLLLPSSSQTWAKFQPWQRLRESGSVSDGPSQGAQPPGPGLRPPLSPRPLTSTLLSPPFHDGPGWAAGLGQAGAWGSGSASQHNATAHQDWCYRNHRPLHKHGQKWWWCCSSCVWQPDPGAEKCLYRLLGQTPLRSHVLGRTEEHFLCRRPYIQEERGSHAGSQE